ncbi:MAG: LPS export ABC transporter periplasmic protein LptC [Candidatus Omnitrophica bacterium]|nr:LPS export ABC transporter periplasmic protein LptC [Candidatus Omnitrophota bacterium]
MMFRKIIFVVVVSLFFCLNSYAQEAQPVVEQGTAAESGQQINDFSIAGYGEKGKKTWDMSGKTADIMMDSVKLTTVQGNLYGKEENVNLVADTGDFNKANGKVHLEKNVVITTTSGTKLTTNSLDWDRKAQMVTTKDEVNIERQNVSVEATGAKGEPGLKKVALEKDVTLNINPTPEGLKEKIIVTCDGPLEIDYEKNLASFNNNVKVDRRDTAIYSDKLDIYFVSSSKAKKDQEEGNTDKTSGMINSKVDKIIARGHVRVVRGENVSYSQEAIYSVSDKKITLRGRPKLVIYSTENLANAPSGN